MRIGFCLFFFCFFLLICIDDSYDQFWSDCRTRADYEHKWNDSETRRSMNKGFEGYEQIEGIWALISYFMLYDRINCAAQCPCEKRIYTRNAIQSTECHERTTTNEKNGVSTIWSGSTDKRYWWCNVKQSEQVLRIKWVRTVSCVDCSTCRGSVRCSVDGTPLV